MKIQNGAFAMRASNYANTDKVAANNANEGNMGRLNKTAGQTAANAHTKKAYAAEVDAPAQGQAKTDAPVHVDISEEARKKSLELKEHDEKSALKLDDAFFSQDAKAQRKQDFALSLAKAAEIDPFDNDLQVLGVTYSFNEGTLEKFISDGLTGKAKNASLVANELAQMIRGTIYNKDATVEDRAVNRETALKLAEQIVKDYFENSDEAKAFLDGINRFAENDVLREKGYVVIDNSDITPFKSYQSPVTPDGGVSWNAYAEKYGSANPNDIAENKKQLEAFMKSLNSHSQKWSDEIIKGFDDNEKKVADIISKVKDSLKETDITGSYQRLLKAF